MAKILKSYTGEGLKSKQGELDIYIPSGELIEAINLAIFLKLPLLIMGEPGCGKTRVAEAVAFELHGAKWNQHYFRWDIKSTSKAKDGIYQYDALGRLYDINSKISKDISKYIKDGKLAKAYTEKQNGILPNILLIDEIDKADIDFPNDLLLEIEERKYFIPELNKEFTAKSEAIIFITSNRERELPPAFLRRCLYFYINFPSEEQLITIVKARFKDEVENTEKDELIGKAINFFLELREKIEGEFQENEKKPSTSELLEWFKVINHFFQNSKEENSLDDLQKKQLKIVMLHEKGKLNNKQIPFKQVLLKTLESTQLT